MGFALHASTLAFWALTSSVAAQVPLGQTMPLGEAYRRGLVSIEILGTGGSSGDVISIAVQRKVTRLLRLSLGSGTVLLSRSPKVQNMVVAAIKGLRIDDTRYRPTKLIELSNDARHTYLVEAYCLDFLKENPAPHDRFDLGDVDPAALRIITAASLPGRTPSMIQAALWLDQGVTGEEIKERCSLTPVEWKAAHVSVDSVRRSQEASRSAKSSTPSQSPALTNRLEQAKKLLDEIDQILKAAKPGSWSGRTHLGELHFVVADDGTNLTEIRFDPKETSECGSADVTRGLVIRKIVPIKNSQFEFRGVFGTGGEFSIDGNFNLDGSHASGSWRLDHKNVTVCRGGWVAASPVP